MLITGYKKRSICDQSGNVGFDFLINPSNSWGRFEFGLSGTAVLKFALENGRIYDNDDNFVSSYDPNAFTSISGQVGPTSYDYYINSNLIGLGVPTDTGIYSWIFTNPTDVEAEFDATIKGVVPDYTLSPSGEYFESGYTVTGTMVNNSITNFRIFDITIPDSGAPFFVDSFTTGNISDTGYFYLIGTENVQDNYVLPLIINTNFGVINWEMTISGNNFV
jgi:hypothetical protein